MHFPGHFGARAPWPGFRFNVVHMDGHVHDDIGKEYNFSGKLGWCLDKAEDNVAYGWRFQNLGDTGDLVTTIEGAFDMNKTQR
jgi:hypothetical protein